MLTLREYFKEINIETNSNDFYNDQKFHDFLSSTIVVGTSSKFDLGSGGHTLNPNEATFFDVVDFLVERAASIKNETLGLGYTESSTGKSYLHNLYVNPAVNHLKSYYWEKLYNMVGFDNFIELVLSNSCFMPKQLCEFDSQLIRTSSNNYIQIFGPTRPVPLLQSHYNALKSHRICISSKNLLHRWKPKSEKLEIMVPSHLSLKYGKINLRKCNYIHIYNSMIKSDAITPIKSVIEFTLIVVTKVFSHWWSKPQRNKIFRQIVKFLQLEQYENLTIEVDETSDSLQWLLENFISQLINIFWYVTESSHDTKLSYYPHHLWRNTTSPWINNYIERFLAVSHVKNPTNLGSLRLIPKKNGDYRFLCIPNKTPAYYSKLYNHLNPVREILRTVLKSSPKKHPLCYSNVDVINQISKFKPSASIFAIKFDMRQSYDRLDQIKIIKCVESLLGNGDEEFYVREFETASSILSNYRKRKYLIQNKLNDLIDAKLPDEVVIDKSLSVKLSKKDIINIVEHEVFHSVVKYKAQFYKRKRGVFQGYPLSATLCEIVYTKLVEEFFQFLGDESLCIRLADDFLILSNSYQQIEKIYSLLKNEKFTPYGASVNIEKTITNLEKQIAAISFVGLKIDLKTLEIQEENEIIIKQNSFSKIYLYLISIFKHHRTITSLNRILNSFNRNFQRVSKVDKYDEYKCLKFILQLLELSLDNIDISDFQAAVKTILNHGQLKNLATIIYNI